MYYYLAYNIAIINIQLQRNANSINYVVTIFGNNKLNAYICNTIIGLVATVTIQQQDYENFRFIRCRFSQSIQTGSKTRYC